MGEGTFQQLIALKWEQFELYKEQHKFRNGLTKVKHNEKVRLNLSLEQELLKEITLTEDEIYQLEEIELVTKLYVKMNEAPSGLYRAKIKLKLKEVLELFSESYLQEDNDPNI